jgi:cytochrome oxidase Cu insertion factor (SCO1/SenC/PrrC family)
VSPKTANRLKLVGIGILAAAPVVASYLLYWFWVPERYTNYGKLLEPGRIPAVALQTTDGTAFTFEALRGRWIMLTVDGGKCGPRCEEKLWQARQVRQAQGPEMDRIERVWLLADNQDPPAQIARDYRGTWMVRGRIQPVTSLLPAEHSVLDHIYLIDPRGYLVMRFPAHAEPKRIIQDLARLLKYSRVG